MLVSEIRSLQNFLVLLQLVFFISFGLTILILVYVIDPLFVKHEEFGMFEGNLALFFLFAFAIFTFIILFFDIGSKENSIFEAHFG